MIEWHEIDTVMLDMDGTLLDLHFDDFFWQNYLPERYADKNDLEIEAAKDFLFAEFALHSGTLDWYCLDFWSEKLAMDVAALKEDIRHLIQIRSGVLEFLDFLAKNGKKRLLVTNAHDRALKLKMRETGLSAHFDRIISSHDLGLPKEDVRFWDALLQIEFFNKHRTLFVDDSFPVLRSANHYGIKYLFGISKPSTQAPGKTSDEFQMLDNFLSLIYTN